MSRNNINERGLPSIGGVSPGDTSNTLGIVRPTIRPGTTGGHSRSADSQNAMGRINIGREDDEALADRPMFPDNIEKKDDEEDIYNMTIRSKLSLDLRGRKAMPERKDLTKDIDELILENETLQMFLEGTIFGDDREGILGKLTDIAYSQGVDLAGDLSKNIASAIPGLGWPAKGAQLTTNIIQISKANDDAKKILNLWMTSPEMIMGAELDDIDDIISNYMIDYSDIIEVITAAVTPDAETPVGESAAELEGLLSASAQMLIELGGIASVSAKRALFKGLIKTFRYILFEDKFDLVRLFFIFNKIMDFTPIEESFNLLIDMLTVWENVEGAYENANDTLGDDYNDLSNEQRIVILRNLFKSGGLAPIENMDLLSEVQLRCIVKQVLNESVEHDCEKEHPGQTCEEWHKQNPDLEEHSVGGFAGPLSSPQDPKAFNKRMEKVSFPK